MSLRLSFADRCVVALDGASITILDSGGVGDNIFWNVVVTDECGNSRAIECHVEVVSPAKGPRKP